MNNQQHRVRAAKQGTSSYMDLSFLYGASETAADSIRTFENGQIITSGLEFNSTEQLVSALYGSDSIVDLYDTSSQSTFINNIASLNIPSFDYDSNSNSISNLTQCPLFSHASVNSGLPNVVPLQALTALFALEHNRIASELGQNYSYWTDEKLFYEARQLNIALFQHITYNEYIPIFLAQNYNNMGFTYDNATDATTSNLFCSVAMRYGHGTMPSLFPFGGHKDGKTWGTANFGEKVSDVVAEVPFRDTYDHPCLGLQEIGSENYLASIMAGLMLSSEMKITPKYCEEIRSFMSIAALKTTDNDITNWDLMAVDLLRYVCFFALAFLRYVWNFCFLFGCFFLCVYF